MVGCDLVFHTGCVAAHASCAIIINTYIYIYIYKYVYIYISIYSRTSFSWGAITFVMVK